MNLTGSLPGILHGAVDRVTWAAKHPLSATAQTVGAVKGVAVAGVQIVARRGAVMPGYPAGPTEAGIEPDPESAEDVVARSGPQAEGRPAAPQRAPEPPHEAFATEPTAVTRGSGHGERGDDAEIDDWLGDAELDLDPDADPATGSVVEALERGDGPGGPEAAVDHSAMKSVISESETLRRAAENGSD